MSVSIAGLCLITQPVFAQQKPELKDMSIGSPSAKVTVIGYISPTCGFCAEWYGASWTQFEKTYISTGRVRFVAREFATAPQELTYALYMLGRCAADKATLSGKDASKAYFTIIHGFMPLQKEAYAADNLIPVMERLSASAGLSKEDIKVCLDDDALYQAVSERANQWHPAIEGAPTFVIGQTHLGGSIALKGLDAAIAEAEKRR